MNMPLYYDEFGRWIGFEIRNTFIGNAVNGLKCNLWVYYTYQIGMLCLPI